jgi:uncharacterized repeat protein (TIGR01451 family)
MRTRNIMKYLLPLLIVALLASCTGDEHPSISLTKSASSDTFTQAGDVITYTYVVTNTGNTYLHNLQLADGSTSISCPSDFDPVNRTVTCTWEYTVTAADMVAGQVNTTATAKAWTGGNCCGQSTMVSATANVVVTLAPEAQTGLVLVKTADRSSYSEVGEVITYTYTVTNTGDAPLTAPITITDSLNAVDCPALPEGGLAPGDDLTCTGTYTVTLDDMRASAVSNIATAHAGDLQSNQVSLDVPIDAQPVLTLVKRADPGSYMYAGDVITFTLQISNDGNVPLNGPLVINDSMISDWTCTVDPVEVLMPGEMFTCTSTLVISEGTVGASLTNTATVSLTYGDTTVTSNEASAQVLAIPTAVPVVDCSIYSDPVECMNAGCHPDSTNPEQCNP